MNLLKNLNSVQKKAVQTYEGPLLILAGAGSGKTRVLTHRVSSLILDQSLDPNRILAITFTNKAANEMSGRVFNLLNQEGWIQKPTWINTFHSFCVRILRRHSQFLDIPNSFSIYDQKDQMSLIKKSLVELNFDEKIYPPKAILSQINKAKTMALSPDEIEKRDYEFANPSFISIYRTYENKKNESKALDFGDLLFKTYDLFSSQPDILSFYQEHFKYVMVDEYQDTNLIQYMIVKKVAMKHQNICVTGDEDQSIYSWRGANIRNILSFKKDFPSYKLIKLEQNYRSTQIIVAASHHLIKNNEMRQEKTLFTQNPKGNKIVLKELEDENEEAFYIVYKIQSLMKQDSLFDYKDFAIFYRTNAQSRVLEDRLRKENLPYKIVGGLRFFDRMEIKDMISYLKILSNPMDDLSLRRIINVPTRGIGSLTLNRLESFAYENHISIYEALQSAVKDKLFPTRPLSSLRSFLFMMENLKKESQNLSLLDLYLLLLEQTKYKDALEKQEGFQAKERLKNLEELTYVIEQFEKEIKEEEIREEREEIREEREEREENKKSNLATIEKKKWMDYKKFQTPTPLALFLEKMTLMSDEEERTDDKNSISLMTLHVAKGLEFQNVFIAGLENGLLPSIHSWDSSKKEELEEERRLLYVGITRAQKNLVLSYARERHRWGKRDFQFPSCFLEEIPPHLIKREGEAHTKYKFPKPSSLFPLEDRQEKLPSFSQGMKVHHCVFGWGLVCKVEGSGKKKKISVSFGTPPKVRKFMANSLLISKDL